MIHIPVLLNEAIEYLNLAPGKRMIDATLDGGGHTREILKRQPDVQVMGIEFDPVEVKELKEKDPELVGKIKLENASYIEMERLAKEHEFYPDAILFDLGLSSWHYLASGRGFTFQKDEMLDMRFNPEVQTRTAADILNTADKGELEHILAFYGEEQYANEIAQEVIDARQVRPIVETGDLVAVVNRAVPTWYKHQKIHFATKTFQALRLVVNDELESVRKGVQAAINVLRPGGRVAVISFHGLEDKIVREIFKKNAEAGVIKWVTKRTIKPSWQEIKQNPRSRSAKMKIAEKLPTII